MIENELSFLVKKLPELSGVLSKEIEQHYLSEDVSPQAQPLRLRRSGHTFELTKKITLDPDDKSRLDEITIPLTSEEYFQLLPLAKRSLTKTRYYLRLPSGLTAELDVFQGTLKGLAMVEVEFPSEESRAAFTPPRWFGRDVSQEAWSSNVFLAGKSYAAVKKHLAPATGRKSAAKKRPA